MKCAHMHQWLLSEDRPRPQLSNATYRSQKGTILATLCLKGHITGTVKTILTTSPSISHTKGALVKSFIILQESPGVKPANLLEYVHNHTY